MQLAILDKSNSEGGVHAPLVVLGNILVGHAIFMVGLV